VKAESLIKGRLSPPMLYLPGERASPGAIVLPPVAGKVCVRIFLESISGDEEPSYDLLTAVTSVSICVHTSRGVTDDSADSALEACLDPHWTSVSYLLTSPTRLKSAASKETGSQKCRTRRR
jgi:hypothetical protein